MDKVEQLHKQAVKQHIEAYSVHSSVDKLTEVAVDCSWSLFVMLLSLITEAYILSNLFISVK